MPWLLYRTTTYNFMLGSVVVSIVLWGKIGTVAAIVATGFPARYFSQSEHGEEQNQP